MGGESCQVESGFASAIAPANLWIKVDKSGDKPCGSPESAVSRGASSSSAALFPVLQPLRHGRPAGRLLPSATGQARQGSFSCSGCHRPLRPHRLGGTGSGVRRIQRSWKWKMTRTYRHLCKLPDRSALLERYRRAIGRRFRALSDFHARCSGPPEHGAVPGRKRFSSQRRPCAGCNHIQRR